MIDTLFISTKLHVSNIPTIVLSYTVRQLSINNKFHAINLYMVFTLVN